MADVNKRGFELSKVSIAFSKCRSADDQILLDEYIGAYIELSRLFDLLGSVFTFVQSDVQNKLSILTQHRQGAAGHHYATVQSMVDYEVNNDLTKVKTNKLLSGCRTLLRLHRALEFISRFLHDVRASESGQKLGGVASKAYQDTLANHHTWLIRKGVGLAVYTLPTRDHLLEKMSCQDVEEASDLVQELTNRIQPVYDIVQALYLANDIINLP